MSKRAFIFPGQGAQSVGMGKALIEQSAYARQTYEEADEALGEPLSKLILEGPSSELTLTQNTQPAILTTSIACFRALEEAGVPLPDFMCGHSLGEYSALVASGAMDFQDAVRTVRKRGEFMQAAVAEGEGAMAAILGLDAARIAEVCQEVSTKDAFVSVANYNGPAQTVIAGHAQGIENAEAALKEAGAKRVIKLPVSAPFHCQLMEPVKAQLQSVLDALSFETPVVPIVANVTAKENQEASAISELLIDQVTAPVRFTEIVEHLMAQGVTTFVEVGPGKALSGMVKRMSREVTLMDVSDAEGVQKLASL